MNTGKLYRRAWRLLPFVPRPIVYGVAHLAADITWRLNGASVQQMRKNYSSFTGSKVPESMVREGVRSYFRCYAEQFTLPGLSGTTINEICVYPGVDEVKRYIDDGPLVLALTHSGNWDMAGAWFCHNGGEILTVAEKLNPPELFDAFVEFRNSLGMEIIGVAPGEHVFGQLRERAQGRHLLVPLLADRDISGSGVEVELGASRALVAAGPAALAVALDRPLIAGFISYRKEKGKWRMIFHFTKAIPRPQVREGESVVEEWTKAWVAALQPAMTDHLVDWHMMQKVFVHDLDPKRLARAREREAAARRTQEEEDAG
ncbi:phosphatidylinositol mannoside acyltransferase [Actinomyces minihominis]|uniref:phosphatidylinositol mannoside acyltransferase n=1 Tax=Actinomyces minihominis TaxID=2002838 RepID=UPI000C0727A2|nr:phosphatidylinositol mannoside acyltransferase [Actinomyces minihominis]